MLDAAKRYAIPPNQHVPDFEARNTSPQITPIDADAFLRVNLRYLRHLRAKMGGSVNLKPQVSRHKL